MVLRMQNPPSTLMESKMSAQEIRTFDEMAIVPVFTDARGMFFCQDTQPEAAKMGEIEFQTNRLRTNVKMSLLALADNDAMREAGYQDPTDTIDPAITLAELVVVTHKDGQAETHVLRTENMPYAPAVPPSKSDSGYRVMVMNYRGLHSVGGQKVMVTALGTLNVETAELYLDGTVKNADADSTDNTHYLVTGYSLLTQRTNMNRREVKAAMAAIRLGNWSGK